MNYNSMTFDEALNREKELKRKLFEIKVKIETNKNNEELLKELYEEIKIIKKEIARVHFIIIDYKKEYDKERGSNNEKYKRK